MVAVNKSKSGWHSTGSDAGTTGLSFDGGGRGH